MPQACPRKSIHDPSSFLKDTDRSGPVWNVPPSEDLGQLTGSIQLIPGLVDRLLQITVCFSHSRAERKMVRGFSCGKKGEPSRPALMGQP